MKYFRKLAGKLTGWICLLAAATLFTCEKVPEYCKGSGEWYDPNRQFCFAGEAHDLCGGKEYNLNDEACEYSTVYRKCEGDKLVPQGTPCNVATYTLTTTAAAGGKVERVPDRETYSEGTPVAVTATPDSGYTFTGWTGASTSTNNIVTLTMDSDKDLIAVFSPISIPNATTYKLAAYTDPQDGSGGTTSRIPNSPDSIYNARDLVVVTATPANGYAFRGWVGSGVPAAETQNAEIRLTMDANKALTAMFAPIPYTLTTNVTPEGSGEVTRSPNKASYTINEQVTLKATPKNHYEFDKWTGAEVSDATSDNAVVTISGDMTVTANFRRKIYTLTIDRNTEEGGTVTPASPQNVEAGVPVDITATRKTGYAFDGWTVTSGTAAFANASSANTTVTLSSNATIVARFSEREPEMYTLTINRSPSGGGTFTPASGERHREDTPIRISATATDGYEFDKWTTTTSGNVTFSDANEAATTVTLSGNAAITANFVRGKCTYRGGTVEIGGLTWMAANLNCETDDSWCYGGDPANCDKYGRLYTWDAAKRACEGLGDEWRLPTNQDWNDLVSTVGSSPGTKLKSTTGWNTSSGYIPGTDNFGFSALPGGHRWSGSFYYAGDFGYWWSATENGSGLAYSRCMDFNIDFVNEGWYDKDYGFSARCVRDYAAPQ